jgi:predicted transcriptional regulator
VEEVIVARLAQEVTEAELSVLQEIWDRGASTIRQLTDSCYPDGGTSCYATVQKLLDRLESKGFVTRNRNESVHWFEAAIGRDELIGRRLQAVAETLCGGSLTPLLSHLVRAEKLSPEDRAALRALIED